MDEIRRRFEELEAKAQKDGVDLEMLVTGADTLVLGYQGRKLEKFESRSGQVAGVRVVANGASGYASTENLSSDAMVRSYTEALANARMIQSKQSTVDWAVNDALSDPMEDLCQNEDIDIENKMKIAERLESELLAADGRITNVPYSSFRQASGWKRILNSRGLDRVFKASNYTGYAYGLAKEGDATKMDGESFYARKFADIDVGTVVNHAARRATSRLGARVPETGRYPILLDREIGETFLAMLESYLSARAVKENRSLFAKKLGKEVAGSKLTLIDDPFDRRGASCRPFDDEGSPSQKTTLIENGILKGFLTNLDLSKSLNLPHTASAARHPASEMDVGATNLFVQLGEHSQETLLQGARVIHVTEIAGALHAGFKEASGDFSLPVEGFIYENGANQGPIDQFVLSGNILQLFADIVKIGNQYQNRISSRFVPDLLIRELSVAGR